MRKHITFITAAAMILNGIVFGHTANAETTETAEAVFENVTVQTGFDKIGGTLQQCVKGDKNAILLSPNDTDYYVGFSFEDSFKSGSGAAYDFEIEYYDGDDAFLAFEYDSTDYKNEIGGIIYTQNTGEWKKAVFTVDNAYFRKRLDTYDFRLSTVLECAKTAKSENPAAVGSVKVTKRADVYSVQVNSTTAESGNTFAWYEKSKVITSEFENITAQSKTLSVNYKLVNRDNKLRFERNEEFTLRGGRTKTVGIDIGDIDECGIYQYIVTVTYADGKSVEHKPVTVAIVKTDPNGILNDDILFATHLEWYGDENIQNDGLDMIKKSNSGGIRANFDWDSMEKTKGELTWDTHISKNIVETAYEKGLNFIPVLSGSSLFYCRAWNEMPADKEQLDGWSAFAAKSAEILKNYGVSEFEIWNEPNLSGFNADGDDGAAYAKLVKTASDAIKGVIKDAKIGGPAVTGINGYWGRDYFTAALDGGLADSIDAITLHSYTDGAVDVTEMDENIKWFLNKYREYDSGDVEIWNTETGYSSADDGIDEETKGALNTRAAILYRQKGLSDKVVFYNFEKKGYAETNKEHQFGHVSPASARGESSGKSFVPEVSYAMVTGMNYVLAQSEAEGITDFSDGNVRVCRFASKKFNADILAVYAVNNSEYVTLDVGTDSVSVYDSVGNSADIRTVGGKCTIKATREPIYIVGNIGESVEKTAAHFSMKSDSFELAEGEVFLIELEKCVDGEYEVETDLPQGVSVIKNSGFDGNKAKIMLLNNGKIGSSCGLTVKIVGKDGTAAVFDADAKTVSAGNADKYQLKIYRKNLKDEYSADERIEFEACFINTSEESVEVNLKYELFDDKNGLLMSDIREYSAAGYSVCGDELVVPISETGEYRLRITATDGTGNDLAQESLIFARKDKNKVYTIAGNIPSGKENAQVALAVFPGKDGGAEAGEAYGGIYHDQQTTDINGKFEFKISVPYDEVKAYAISEDGDVLEFTFGREEKLSVYLADGLVKLDNYTFEELSSLPFNCVVEWKNAPSQKNYDIYAALYKGNTLVSVVKAEDETEAVKLAYKSYPVTDGSAAEYDKIKVMLWDGESGEPVDVPYTK